MRLLKAHYETDNNRRAEESREVIGKLQEQIHELQNDNNIIENKLNINELSGQMYVNDQIKALNRSLFEHMIDLRSDNAAGASNEDFTFITFRAFASTDRDYNKSDIVIFDVVKVDNGNHYNVTTSVFHCPVSGYYLFTVALLNRPAERMGSNIILDDEPLHKVYCIDSATYDQASTTVVTLCSAGQTVYVQSTDDDNHLFGSSDNLHSSFSGTLLRVA